MSNRNSAVEGLEQGVGSSRPAAFAGVSLPAGALPRWRGAAPWALCGRPWTTLSCLGKFALEWIAIAVWTVILVQPYLNPDPTQIPTGSEYLSGIQTHYLWAQMRECGLCALWNGNVRGGAPAFADPHGSMLHPLVIITTLGWGVLQGSKLALAGAFLIAGLAQWWLGYVLGLGWAARVWTGAMAVAGGHLAGRMELGAFGVVLSTACCALVLPPLVALCRSGSRRDAVLLGIMLALAALAGQGYMQVGLLLTLSAVLILLPWEPAQSAPVLRRLGLAFALGFLLAGPLLIPFLRFWPEFYKETDPLFRTAQPFTWVPLNLVISDRAFHTSDALGKLGYPHLNFNYVGWWAVLLAIGGVSAGLGGSQRRLILFLLAVTVLPLWIASAVPLRWLAAQPIGWFADLAAGIRHPSQIAGLAIPPLLALAGYGLERLLRQAWPRLRLAFAAPEKRAVSLDVDFRWLLVIPLVLAVQDARAASSPWIATAPLNPNLAPVLEALRTPGPEWVNPPFGEHFWIPSALSAGLKMHFGIRTWNWKNRPHPEPVLEANRAGPPPGMGPTPVRVVDGVPIYAAPPGREYAAVTDADNRRTVCAARAAGGDIDITCETTQPGTLTVFENSWSGWHAWIDGQAAPLKPSRWLAVDLPPGWHEVHFRYRPWDVPLGLGLFIAGLALAVYCWRRPGSCLTPPA